MQVYGTRRRRQAWAVGAALLLTSASAAVIDVTRPDGGGLPEQVTAGYVEVRLDTGQDATATLFRLHEGVGRAAFEAAVARANTGEDFAATVNETLRLLDVVLEVRSLAGAAGVAGAVLEAGEYALAYQGISEDGLDAEPFYAYFTAVPGAGDPAPPVDGTVRAAEFLFSLPAGLTAGEQTWAVVNEGEQLHNMVLFRLNEGATPEDLRAWLGGGGGAPPGEEAGYVGLFGPGETVYQTLDLPAGTYVAVCFVPHHGEGGDGAPHFLHGMIQRFEVGP